MPRLPRYYVAASGHGVVLETDNITHARRRFEALCKAEPTLRVSLHDGVNGVLIARQEGTDDDDSPAPGFCGFPGLDAPKENRDKGITGKEQL